MSSKLASLVGQNLKEFGSGVFGLKELILVSGYYGFGNLGDEAILEALLIHLESLGLRSRAVVLSHDPQETHRTFEVMSVDRFDLIGFYNLLQRSRLFISGGGGLFQDATSVKSVLYYSMLHHLASLAGVESFVFAQGLGPLHSPVSNFMARRAYALSRIRTVRDERSHQILDSWGLEGELTADPVWLLRDSSLPEPVRESFESVGGKRLLGLSLRKWKGLEPPLLQSFARDLIEHLPEDLVLVPLSLQDELDKEPLSIVSAVWKEAGRSLLDLELNAGKSGLERPSQWLALFGKLDFLIGMRLHSLIMALSMGVPVFGLSYDHKVENVMKEFDQPFLNLVNNSEGISRISRAGNLVKDALVRRQETLEALHAPLERVRADACKNFLFLDRILGR